MPKEDKKKKYHQKYKKSWETEEAFTGWLKSAPDGNVTRAYCVSCKCTMFAHRQDLLKHSTSKKHSQSVMNMKEIRNTVPITQFTKLPLTKKRKLAELKIAAFIAEHCSIQTVDHLGDLIKKLDDKSEVLTDIKLHRTKCTALITNVLSPCILQELIEDVGDSFYSLIIDESTAVDCKKLLCLMIRYFSGRSRKVVTTFYRLIEIESGNSDAIVDALTERLEKDGLKIEHLLGIGVDGANVMVGAHNSVSSKLKSRIPHLVVVKCICHSLHLAGEKACEMLPRHLDFMVRETYNWFAWSTKRQIEYREIYQTIAGNLPKKIIKLSTTRWLVRHYAIETILEQWDALKLLFNIARDRERCHVTTQLSEMYNSAQNKLYLVFLNTSLKGLIGLNKLFQSNSADPLKLLEDLNNLLYLYLQQIVVPRQLEKVNRSHIANYDFHVHLMSTDCINFGYNFNVLCSSFSRDEATYIKERCKQFLVTLSKEIQKRVPENVDILEKISTFSPKVALSQRKPDITDIVVRFGAVCGDIDSRLQEWNLIHRLQITHDSTEMFWAAVDKDIDAGGQKRFPHLTKLALSLMSLPFSNGAVERAFSIVNIVKNKLRNRLSINTAESLLRVRYGIASCIDFVPTAKMLEMFNTEQMYEGQPDEDIFNAFADC